MREMLSARLDGELAPDESAELDAHLESCVACQAHAYRLDQVQRRLRVRVPDPVPDLTDRLMAALPPVRRRLQDDIARLLLASIALTQLVFAVPQLFAADSSEPIHVSRHLGSWDLAFAIGLLIVAWRPSRARGLLPMAVALASAMAVTAVIDLGNGHAAGLAEASHVFEIVGVLLVWALARTSPPELGPGVTSGGGFRPLARWARRSVPGLVRRAPAAPARLARASAQAEARRDDDHQVAA